MEYNKQQVAVLPANSVSHNPSTLPAIPNVSNCDSNKSKKIIMDSQDYGKKLVKKLEKDHGIEYTVLQINEYDLNEFGKKISQSDKIDPQTIRQFAGFLRNNFSLFKVADIINDTQLFPFVQKLLQAEYTKFIDDEVMKEDAVLNAAIILNCLIKVHQILECSSERIQEALQKVVTQQGKQAQTSQDEKDLEIEDMIKRLEATPTLLMDVCQALEIADPEEIKDESKEPHGWSFASIIDALFHPIEFVQEKIWGKKKVHRSTDEIEEKDTEIEDIGRHDHSTSYFKEAISWLFNLSGFFSTPTTDTSDDTTVAGEHPKASGDQ